MKCSEVPGWAQAQRGSKKANKNLPINCDSSMGNYSIVNGGKPRLTREEGRCCHGNIDRGSGPAVAASRGVRSIADGAD